MFCEGKFGPENLLGEGQFILCKPDRSIYFVPLYWGADILSKLHTGKYSIDTTANNEVNAGGIEPLAMLT